MLAAYALAAGLALASGSAAMAECKLSRVGELPVEMRGLMPVVRATVNGRAATFRLDSGDFFSSISPGGAHDYALPLGPAPEGFYVSGVGGVMAVQVAKVHELGLLGTTIKGMEFLVGGSEVGAGIGTIGQSVLGLGDVEYDLPAGAVRLFKSSGCSDTGLAYWAKGGGFFSVDLKPAERSDNHTVATVYVNDAPIEAIFDTGAPSTILSLRAAARAGVRPGDAGVQQVGSTSGFGRRTSTVWVAKFKTIRIGNEQLANARLAIADLGAAEMLIGADFFVSHRMFVSNAARRIDFTYNGGRVFNTEARTEGDQAKAAMIATETKADTADALARRGGIALVQHDYANALKDLDAAVAAAPGEARFLAERAQVQFARGEAKAGFDDIDAAVKLDPTNADARLIRARHRLSENYRAGALEDVDAVARSVGQANDDMLEVGELYAELGAYDRAVDTDTRWIAAHPDDPQRLRALNNRCWARGLSGKDLDAALADCNAAVRRNPRVATFLDSRALVQYRRGHAELALSDANAALAIEPRLPWSLWIRALIEDKAGDKIKAAADRKTAEELRPGIANAARDHGVT